jgi:hypothetical protein
MEPLVIGLLPGFFGGLVLALLLARTRRKAPKTFVPRPLAPPSPSLINMAHIPVEGVGGLGMLAAVVAVVIIDPRIRFATILAAVLGAGLALTLIALRRDDRLRPGGTGNDGGSTLHLDEDRRRKYFADVHGRLDGSAFRPPRYGSAV